MVIRFCIFMVSSVQESVYRLPKVHKTTLLNCRYSPHDSETYMRNVFGRITSKVTVYGFFRNVESTFNRTS